MSKPTKSSASHHIQHLTNSTSPCNNCTGHSVLEGYTGHVSQHPSVTGLDAVLQLLCHWSGLRAKKKHLHNAGFIDEGSLLQGNPSVTQQVSHLPPLTPCCNCPHCNCSPYTTFSAHHVTKITKTPEHHKPLHPLPDPGQCLLFPTFVLLFSGHKPGT